MTRVRMLRVLEYEGPREWLDDVISRRGVKGEIKLPNEAVIREAFVGDTPTILVDISESDGTSSSS